MIQPTQATATAMALEAQPPRDEAGPFGRGFAAFVPEAILGQADRWFLWTPVALGLGITGYFALPSPPPLATAVLALMLGLMAAIIAMRLRRGRPLMALALAGLAWVGAGYAAAAWRTAAVAAPVLQRAGTFDLTGRIAELNPTERGGRLLLTELEIERLAPAATPRFVRVTVRDAAGLGPGDRVAVLARLQPPSAPLYPGGYDFARSAWFQQLGGVGFALGRAERIEAAPRNALRNATSAIRTAVAARLTAVSPDAAGHMSAALLTGLQAGIDDAVWRDMQRSGLVHLISISGLHMTLVAGTLFLTLRFALGLIPTLALRWPVKKWAAIGGILGATGYLMISGASIPTQRSWITVVIGFLAILVDRNPISLRLLAVAAAIVLLLRPDSLLGASFQLSFAAVLALIAAYEAGAGRLVPRAGEGLLHRLGPLAYVGGVCVTTVIASTATAPLTAWHFHSIATYGVLANLIAVPLTSFLIMPVGLIAMALMPFGLEVPFAKLMVWGVELVLATAHWMAAQPGAAVSLPPMPAATLPLFALGGLWLCLWRGRGRLLALVPLALSVVLAVFAKGPDLLVDRTFGMAAVRAGDGSVRLLQRDRDSFVLDGWQRVLGVDDTEPFPAAYAGPADGLACDPGGCVLERDGRKLALAWAIDAVLEDCRVADLVIAAVGPEQCDGPADLVGRWALWRSGGIAVWFDADAITVETAAERRGAWPWVR